MRQTAETLLTWCEEDPSLEQITALALQLGKADHKIRTLKTTNRRR